jgi:hypothetical protein
MFSKNMGRHAAKKFLLNHIYSRIMTYQNTEFNVHIAPKGNRKYSYKQPQAAIKAIKSPHDIMDRNRSIYK